ncbi:MAG: SBBP repeat-containing protein [Acidobacteriia bacterium]|nr:SBBP repeat-containing protein [Terriglobia bacterium]
MRSRYIGIAVAIAAVLAGTVVSLASAGTTANSPADQARVLSAYAKLPLSFEANRGQADSNVRFLSRGHGYSLLLTGDQAILVLKRGTANQGAATTAAISLVRMRLAGANASAASVGVDPLPGKANYFIGKDAKNWRTNVPTYARVKYSDVYPGIDLMYYGNQQQLEYDFVVRPDIDPRTIHLDFSGTRRASDLAIDRNGDLLVKTDGGDLRFHKPIVYQVDSTGAKLSVDAHYALQAGQSGVSFAVGSYDRSRELVIDPVLVYSTYLGATQTDVVKDIALDGAGNAYISGQTFSSDFPTTAGAFDRTCGGCTVSSDDFVAKINPSGSALVYSTYLGGSSVDASLGIAVDSAGNAYAAGFTQSTDFPVTAGAFRNTLKGSQDGTLTKLDPTGASLLYSTYFGGKGKDQALKVALDGSAKAYITGFALSSDLPTTPGVFQPTFGGGSGRGDAYVAKFDTTQSGAASLIWCTYLGGSSDDTGASLVIDALGNSYITGGTSSTNFPTTPGAFRTTLTGGGDAYVAKLNPTGSALVYSTYVGGSLGDEGVNLALDSAGNAYVAGSTDSTDFPATAGALQTVYGGNNNPINCNFSFFTHCGDGFVAKVNTTGSALSYATYLGGNGADYASGIRIDSSGDAFVTGATDSTNFPTVNPLQPSFLGVTDVIVSEINPAGSALLFSTYLGGKSGDGGSGLTLDSAGNIYVIGYTESPDFPLANALQTTYGGGKDDGFISKISLATSNVVLSKTSLTYITQVVNTVSKPKPVTLTNIGTTALTITSILPTGTNAGDFAQTNTCGNSVPAGGNCTINITFTPTAAGKRTASITITDSDPSSPQKIALTGTGTFVQFSKADLIFGNQAVGTTSSPKKATLTNTGTTALTINSFAMTGLNPGDFMQTNDCPISPNTLAAGAFCTITVTFTPTQTGGRQANVTVNSSDLGSPSNLVVKGTGI